MLSNTDSGGLSGNVPARDGVTADMSSIRAVEIGRPRSWSAKSKRRRPEQHRHAPRSTPRAHQPTIEARQREVRSPRPHQSLQVKLARVVTFALRLHALALTPGTARSDAPAGSECVSECLDGHENIMGTFGEGWQDDIPGAGSCRQVGNKPECTIFDSRTLGRANPPHA